jgi:hypothetical protein
MGICRRFPAYVNRHHTEICGEFSALPVEMLVLPVKEMTEVKKQRGRPKK